MRLRFALVLAFAAVFVVGIFLAGLPEDTYDDGELDRLVPRRAGTEDARDVAAGEEAPPPPQLVGRAEHEAKVAEWLGRIDKVPEPKVPTFWAKGTVLDADGGPVTGAQVYHLVGGSQARMAMRTVTTSDAAGAFRLRVDQWAHTTFAARLPLGGAVFVSADDVSPEDEIRLVLPRPMDLNILVVRPDGSGLEGVSITVAPVATRRPGVYLEEPDTPEHAQVVVTDAGGVALFHFTRPDPVRITPAIVDATFEPESLTLARPEGHVTFEARDGCRLVLKVIDTETGDPLQKQVHVTIYEIDTWERIDGFRTDGSMRGIDETLALAPGRYAVELTAAHQEPEWISDILVEYPGQTIEREVRMRPMASAGRLVLRLPAGSETTLQGLKAVRSLQPWLLLHRRDGGHAVRGYLLAALAYHRDDNTFRCELRPGTYDGILVFWARDAIASFKGLLVMPGEETDHQVSSTRRGTTITVADLIPEGVEITRASVTVPGRGRFPLFGRGFGRRVHGAESLRYVLARLAKLPKAKRTEVILGPYPSEGATIVLTDSEGNTHRGVTR